MKQLGINGVRSAVFSFWSKTIRLARTALSANAVQGDIGMASKYINAFFHIITVVLICFLIYMSLGLIFEHYWNYAALNEVLKDLYAIFSIFFVFTPPIYAVYVLSFRYTKDEYLIILFLRVIIGVGFTIFLTFVMLIGWAFRGFT